LARRGRGGYWKTRGRDRKSIRKASGTFSSREIFVIGVSIRKGNEKPRKETN